MENIDELRKRKDELELKRDIAQLERQERRGAFASRAAGFSCIWVGPITFVSAFFLVGSFIDDKPLAIIPGLILLLPLIAKLRS